MCSVVNKKQEKRFGTAIWKNRRTTCEALVLPDAEDILLGAIPLEALDLTINPRKEEVVGAHGDQILHRV